MATSSKAERREAARKEAERLRKIQDQRNKRNRGVLIVVVVAVVALIAVAGVMIYQASGRTLLTDYEGESPAGSDLHGGITFGADGVGSPNEGAPTVDVYLDFQCPHCATFDAVNGEDVTQAAADGDATVVYHPVDFLDGAAMNSTRSANAFLVIASEAPEAASEFMATMFENQANDVTDEQIAQIAVDAGVPQEVADSFSEGTYNEWIELASDQAVRDGYSGTPTIVIDGEVWGTDENDPAGQWTTEGALLAELQSR